MTDLDKEWARIIADIKRCEREHPEAAKIARAIRREQKLNREREIEREREYETR